MPGPTRPDLRDLASHVKEAFAEMDRETLLEILTFVVKEYVVEGPPPMLVHQTETLSDLAGVTFAQLVTAMQTRFDHAELQMFVVDGDQVSVRVGGVMQPLLASRQPLQALPPVAADLPRPAAGVRVVETTQQQRPAAPQPTPPPTRGVSVREVAQPAAAQPAAPAQPATPEKSDKPEGSGDDASARFSLLELD